MGIWRRWWSKFEQFTGAESGMERSFVDSRYEESILRNELRQLLQQRQTLEQRGCFSDRELAAKDSELEAIEERIKKLKSQQFRLRTQGKVHL